MKLVVDPKRILDFDVEARPLSWFGGDFVTREITAIAWSWLDEDEIHCIALRAWSRARESFQGGIQRFIEEYNKADIVTGHFIRGYDLPAINAVVLEYEWPSLKPILAHDTKLDLLKFSGLSKSQENLAAMLGCEAPKIQMTQDDWREANRLTDEGIEKTIERVMGDVEQHKEMRAKLLELGWLGPPRLWTPASSGHGGYHA